MYNPVLMLPQSNTKTIDEPLEAPLLEIDTSLDTNNDNINKIESLIEIIKPKRDDGIDMLINDNPIDDIDSAVVVDDGENKNSDDDKKTITLK